jgi:two-component sensor histidine kinase
MTPALHRPATVDGDSSGAALDYSRALLNILEDTAQEETRLRDTQSAVLNILEDFTEEKDHLEDMKRAVMNILEDLGTERDKLQETQSELLRSEQAIRASLREKETLLKEVHHRVKNNLQVIASLLRLQARYLRDEQARAIFEESQNRVHSISLVHEMLYRAGDLARVDFGNYLRTLTSHLADGWSGGRNIALTVEASGVQLNVDTAIPCGLIVNELVTNAVKHAFPGGASGSVWVRATVESDGWLTLAVQDNGIGLPENLDLRRSSSLGLELVSTLSRQLRAKVDIRRGGGTAFEIRFQPPAN